MFDRETDNVALIYRPAPSETLVVTFAHMDFNPAKAGFWGEVPLARLGHAALGLMCKTNCWYPEPDILALRDYILGISKSYRNVILYGFSMGGYAAVKFSRALQATCSIALSPQFSIEPACVGTKDRRLVRHFRAELNTGMAVRPDDLGGRIYIFLDPYHAQDVWNCASILAQAPRPADIELIHVPRIGHETIDLFAGSQVLSDLLSISLAGDAPRLRALTAALRRKSQRRTFNTLSMFRRRRPDLAELLFDQQAARLSGYWIDRWQAS